MTLPRGLYDQLLTAAVEARLASGDDFSSEQLSSGSATPLLIDLVARTLANVLEDVRTGEQDHADTQLAFVNQTLAQIRALRLDSAVEQDSLVPPLRRLQSIHARGMTPGLLPDTGLANPWLFTAAKQSPSLLGELRREMVECEQIDILVSFITVSGVRKILDLLKSVTAPNAAGVGRTRIRIITTTYTGATELEALVQLASLNGCTVRISLDGRRTRLHAKAWIFHRKSGFGSTYVGSANLSGAALLGGLEWTVKFTERSQPDLYEHSKAHFSTLWADDEFQVFDPQNEANRTAVRTALRREAGGDNVQSAFYFDIVAKRHQQEILEQLQQEREFGRHRNLLVAATGTGKTVMAALDYRHTVQKNNGNQPRLLFVAHREEILKQALATYRGVLRDNNFGALLAGGIDTERFDHLFATIQSVASRDLLEKLSPDHWHTVVVDECHRLAANQFDKFARTIRPAIFLGLTATPERTDGQSLHPYFDSRPDGSPAAELRLWHALELELLAPFEYFGCHDDTDFADVPWGRDGEAQAIDKLVTGNQIRARTVVNEWTRLAGSPARSKALVFCVSVAHARFMQEYFAKSGIKTLCLTGETPAQERAQAPQRLASGEVCAIVTVDLYNEGVDLPDVDTLLFLRPTQSPLLFQQQLGRGLRHKDGKICLVLDFVGHHRAEFRFDRLLGSITGLTRRELLHSVEEGFSSLPSGCHIHLEPQAREQVLRNLRAAVNQSWRNLKTEVQSYATSVGHRAFTLSEFMGDSRVTLAEIYRDAKPSGWTTLRREASVLPSRADSAPEAELSRSLKYLQHVDDPAQLRVMRQIAEQGHSYRAESQEDSMRAQMLTYQVNHSGAQHYSTFVRTLADEPVVLGELAELTAVLSSRTRVSHHAVRVAAELPMLLHATYQLRELLTAVGLYTATERKAFREGVLPLKDRKMEIIFVTLDKSEGFHERIAYRDYAISPSKFHWQTQNSAGPHTASGRRYMESKTNGWTFQLFVRANTESAYVACGPATVQTPEDISGNRPMSIVWTFEHPLSIALFREFSVLRAGE